MVGGIIEAFFIKQDNGSNYIVKFLVKDKLDYCTVMAEIPKEAIDKGFIKNNPIWWQNPFVLIKIEDVQDVIFKKIGASGDNKEHFWEEYNKRLCA